jgi:allantoate deiminase
VRIDSARIASDLETLAQWGRGADGAMTRLALTKEDAAARAWVRDRMRSLGMDVWADEVGNLFGRRRGRKSGAMVLTGSHLDSVPAGGRYDGPFGIVGPLEVVRAWNEAGVETDDDVVVVVFVGEEGSRFKRGTLGSAAASAYLKVSDILQLVDAGGVTFADALKTYGNDPPCTTPARIHPKAFVEMHIEQGGVLESRKIPVGVVETIAGLFQFVVGFTGDANHAGATPMALRRDALAAAAEVISAVEFHATSIGHGAVGTVGKIELAEGAALNIIPGECTIGIDLRAPRADILDAMEEQLREVVRRAGEKRKIATEITVRQKVAPGPMDARVQEALAKAAAAAGFEHLRMPSGAIHDALHMAECCPSSMLFVPSRGGKSHCREEQTDPEDLARGTLVLAHALLALACGPL